MVDLQTEEVRGGQELSRHSVLPTCSYRTRSWQNISPVRRLQNPRTPPLPWSIWRWEENKMLISHFSLYTNITSNIYKHLVENFETFPILSNDQWWNDTNGLFCLGDTLEISLPAYLCLRSVLHSQAFVFEGGEVVRPHVDSPELSSIEDVGYSNPRQIIFLLHRGSVAQVYPRKDLVTVNPVSEKNKSNLQTEDLTDLCRSHLPSFPSKPGISLSSGVNTSRYFDTSWAPSFLSLDVLMGGSI